MVISRALRVALAAASLMPGVAYAQTGVTESFAELQRGLKPDQDVLVTDLEGRTTRGRVAASSDTSLTLRVKPSRHDPDGTKTLSREAIAKVAKPDSLETGWLIGLGAGIAANYVFVRANCGRPGYDPECSANVAVVGLPIFVPIGVVVGALIDHANHRLLYRSPSGGQSASFNLSPLVGKRAGGVALSMAF